MLLGAWWRRRPTEDLFLNPIDRRTAQYIEGIRIGRRPPHPHPPARRSPRDRRRGVLCGCRTPSWGARRSRYGRRSSWSPAIGLWSEPASRPVRRVLRRPPQDRLGVGAAHSGTNRRAWSPSPRRERRWGALVSAGAVGPRTSRIRFDGQVSRSLCIQNRGRLDTNGHPPVGSPSSMKDEGESPPDCHARS